MNDFVGGENIAEKIADNESCAVAVGQNDDSVICGKAADERRFFCF